MHPDDVNELVQRCASLRTELDAHAQAQRHGQARALAEALIEQLAKLRRLGAIDEVLTLAEQATEQLGALARVEPDTYLPVLRDTIVELARGLEQRGQFEAAAAAFGSAAEAQKIAMASRLDAGAHETLTLIELLSRRAVALAEAGRLLDAEQQAQAFLELARAKLPHALPQLCGGLVFLADLATELGHPREAVDHLREGFELLEPLLAQGLPGIREAIGRLGLRLREAAGAAGIELPGDLAGRLDAVLA